MKTLLIITTGLNRTDKTELLRREVAGEIPRATLFERELNSDVVDEIYMQKVPGWRKLFYHLLPAFISQVIEAFYNRNNYDAVISWSERRAFLFALLLKISFSKTKHIAMIYWLSKPKQTFILRISASHIHRIITWSSKQRDYAIEKIGLSSRKVKYFPYCVDQLFWFPEKTNCDMICAVGEEMRDYATLIEAMRGLDIQCRIVAKTIRIVDKYSTRTKAIEEYGPFPANVNASVMSFQDLRSLYKKSKFVVIPLLESETSSGLTVLLEAMAMGKAVICSRIRGQVDVIQEGKTGIFVPQGDPIALREAILNLWNNPELAGHMGREARLYVEKHHSLDLFVTSVKSVVADVILENKEVNS
jgi:glycosyltransferase involved in cell wall biosynthesis